MTTANISPQRDYFSHSVEAEREGGLNVLKTVVTILRSILLVLFFAQLSGCTDIKKNSFSGLQISFSANLTNLKANHYSPPLNYKSTNYPGRQIPQHLMVDLLIAPEQAVITNTRPTFSWSVNDNRPGAKQTAWQIMIASSPENLDENEPDIWNSGKNYSGKSFAIQYSGNE